MAAGHSASLHTLINGLRAEFIGASVVEFTSTAIACHVDRAGTHPLKQDNTPIALFYTKSRTGKSLDFHDLQKELGEGETEPQAELRRDLSLASNFQASRYSGVTTTTRLNMPRSCKHPLEAKANAPTATHTSVWVEPRFSRLLVNSWAKSKLSLNRAQEKPVLTSVAKPTIASRWVNPLGRRVGSLLPSGGK